MIVLSVVSSAPHEEGCAATDNGAGDAVIQRNGLAGECIRLGALTVMKRRAVLSTRRMDPLSAGTTFIRRLSASLHAATSVSAD